MNWNEAGFCFGCPGRSVCMKRPKTEPNIGDRRVFPDDPWDRDGSISASRGADLAVLAP